jgi:LPXTG-motif cell wall-anchored protein
MDEIEIGEATTTTVASTTAPTNTLPATGANSTPLIGAGAGFLLVGAFMLAAARRRVAR